MADIRKRNSKKRPHQVRFLDPANPSGFGYRSFVTKKEARAFAAKCEINEASHHQFGKRITVPEAVSKWLHICEKVGRDGRETVEPQTLIEYERRAKVICEYKWAKHVHQLSPTDVINFRTWLTENKSRDLARRCLSSFHSALLEMKLQGYTASDPAAGITIKANGRYEDSEIEIPTDAEMADILGAIDMLATSSHQQIREGWMRYRPMFYSAIFSGMRSSEYRGLPCTGLSDQSILVTQRADKSGRIGPVKSKAAKRKIIIPDIAFDVLFEWKEISEREGHELLFGTADGKPQFLTNIFTGAWVPLMQEACLMKDVETNNGTKKWPKYTMHCLRHYFASKLIEKSFDLKYIQKTMGHSKIETTLNIYGHLIKGNEGVYKSSANEMATELLSLCGQNVAGAH